MEARERTEIGVHDAHGVGGRLAGTLGWVLVGLLALVVLLETLAAAAITLFISPWLTVAVLAGVIAAGVLIARDAHRRASERPRPERG